MLGSLRVGLVELLQVDLTMSSYLLGVLDQLAVAEGVWSVLDEGKRLSGPLEAVEVDFELGSRGTLLRVDLVLEVGEELLELVDGVAADHVVDEEGGLEDGRDVALSFHFLNALRDHLGDLGAHDLGHFTTVAPKHVCDPLLAELTIDAHVQLEVLVHQQREEGALASRQVRVVLGAFVQHNVGHLHLDFLDPGQVFERELDRLLRIVLKLDGIFVRHEVLTASECACDAGVSLLLPAPGITLDGRAVRV